MRRSFGLPWEIICHLVSFACFLVTFNRKKSLSARPTRHRRRVSMSACLDICFYFVCFRFSTSTASESFHFQPAPSPPPSWLATHLFQLVYNAHAQRELLNFIPLDLNFHCNWSLCVAHGYHCALYSSETGPREGREWGEVYDWAWV